MRRTKADWLILIYDQMSSDLNIREYCDVHDIGISGFYNARSRFGFSGSVEHPSDLSTDSSVQAELSDQNEICSSVPTSQTQKGSESPTVSSSAPQTEVLPFFQSVVVKPEPVPVRPPEEIRFVCNGIPIIIPSITDDWSLSRLIRAGCSV